MCLVNFHIKKYLAAENGGGSGSTVVVNRDSASGWETFRVYMLLMSTLINHRN